MGIVNVTIKGFIVLFNIVYFYAKLQIFIQGKDQRNAMDMREQLYMLEIEKHRGIILYLDYTHKKWENH